MSEISVGGKVRLIAIPSDMKTAEAVPMLRPLDLRNIDDIGKVLDRRPGGYWGVKFDRGSFLLDSKYLEAI